MLLGRLANARAMLGDPSRRLQDIDDELTALRAQVQQERVRERQWVTTDRMRHAILIMLDQAQGDAAPAAKFLEVTAMERHWPARPDEDRRRLAEDVFLRSTCSDAALEEYAAVVDLEDPTDPLAANVALRYVLEWRVVRWATRQNLEKQLAPNTGQLLDRYELERLRLPERVRPPPRGTSQSACARRWATRLRGRWGGRFGAFKAREVVPVGEMRSRARAVWQWMNHLRDRTPPGLGLLRVNLDETSISMHQGGGRGSIFIEKRKARLLAESAPLAKKRQCFTHVALICDRADLQPLMPQVLVVNMRTVLMKELATIRALLPPNVRLVCQTSAWNNSALCARIIALLRPALGVHADGLQIVIVMDAHRVHFALPVLRACRRHNAWPVFVPPRMTWLLQPLDTHAFAIFKRVLQLVFQRARAAAADGVVSKCAFFTLLCDAIRTVLQGRHWCAAFDSDGFGAEQAAVSPRVLEHLQLDAAGARAPVAVPSDDELRLCFPRRSRVPLAMVLPRAVGAAPDALDAVAGRLWRGGRGLRGRGRGRGSGVGVVPMRGASALAGPSRTRSGLVYKP